MGIFSLTFFIIIYTILFIIVAAGGGKNKNEAVFFSPSAMKHQIFITADRRVVFISSTGNFVCGHSTANHFDGVPINFETEEEFRNFLYKTTIAVRHTLVPPPFCRHAGTERAMVTHTDGRQNVFRVCFSENSVFETNLTQTSKINRKLYSYTVFWLTCRGGGGVGRITRIKHV